MPIFKGLLMFMAVCMYYAIPSSIVRNKNSLVNKLFTYNHTYLYTQTTISSRCCKSICPHIVNNVAKLFTV